MNNKFKFDFRFVVFSKSNEEVFGATRPLGNDKIFPSLECCQLMEALLSR